jgi:GrpB-like predicted nucleotidyltransferase (UPF0157 family)
MPKPLGLESKTVRLVPYDDRWPSLFEAETRGIIAAVRKAGLPALVLEHVGSTAVQRLAAKPVLDVAAGRLAHTRSDAYIGAFESLGYEYRGDGGVPGREFFRRGVPRSHHLHLVEWNGAHWFRYMRFRDALRADAALREAYGELKRSLAARYPNDREAYMEGKTEFVEFVLQRSALSWPVI